MGITTKKDIDVILNIYETMHRLHTLTSWALSVDIICDYVGKFGIIESGSQVENSNTKITKELL